MRAPYAALVASSLVLLVAACPSTSPSGDASDGGDEGGFTSHDGAGLCGTFTHSGDPCAPVSAIVCFRQCVTDGCQCKAGADGKGAWRCTTDLSCDPDGSPLDDATPSDSASEWLWALVSASEWPWVSVLELASASASASA